MTDVARAAGVSTALVSIVFRDSPGASDATRARVREIADELGYVRDRRASSLRQSHSRLLGVVFELQQPFHGDLVEHVYSAAARRGYEVALSAVAPSRGETAAIDSSVTIAARQRSSSAADCRRTSWPRSPAPFPPSSSLAVSTPRTR